MVRAKLAQNFLVDPNIARKIVYSAELSKNDTVVEIGPGKGILTELIAAGVKKLILTHLSQRYAKNPRPILNEAKKIFKNVKLAEDFMRIEL